MREHALCSCHACPVPGFVYREESGHPGLETVFTERVQQPLCSSTHPAFCSHSLASSLLLALLLWSSTGLTTRMDVPPDKAVSQPAWHSQGHVEGTLPVNEGKGEPCLVHPCSPPQAGPREGGGDLGAYCIRLALWSKQACSAALGASSLRQARLTQDNRAPQPVTDPKDAQGRINTFNGCGS